MTLPRFTAEQSLGPALGTYRTSPAYRAPTSRLVPTVDQIIPAVNWLQRTYSQAYVTAYCHGLAPCNPGMTALARAARLQQADLCVAHRFRVRSYYVERNIADVGNHDEAIQRDDDVAESCR